MPADTKETATKAYKGLVSLEKPVHVWTPDGGYNAPRHIAEAKSPASMDLPETIIYMKSQSPKQRPLTSGEWHQVREALNTANPEIEENMITGAYERTSTLVDFDHGLVIQIPDADEEGNLIADEKGIIKGRHTWEMALPSKAGYVGQMPDDMAKFFNTIYGMEDAASQLPDYAYFFIDENPKGARNLLRGGWSYGDREDRRVYVLGLWWPSGSRGRVASRGAADSARLVNRLNDAEYAAPVERLLQELKQAQPEQAADIIEKINIKMKGALVWENI